MQNFSYINKERLFFKEPLHLKRCEDGTYNVDDNVLANSLGALLYMPATMFNWSDKIFSKTLEGISAIALDLEDALNDDDIDDGIENIISNLEKLSIYTCDVPHIFVRVRNNDHIERIIDRIGNVRYLLTGFILPKFSAESRVMLETVMHYREKRGFKFYVMPILEERKLIQRETRMDALEEVIGLLNSFKEIILNVRVGATDFTSVYGIRRNVDNTVYDLTVVRDCLTDILNVVGRDSNDFVISGPVFEFFDGHDRLFKPSLREHMFVDHVGGLGVRKVLINECIDGLVKEFSLDKINGFVGKTIIHPSHIKIINSMCVVTYEEYMDALDIISGSSGVSKSSRGNKMNEFKPHRRWAERILMRADAFGVFKEDKNFIDIIMEEVL